MANLTLNLAMIGFAALVTSQAIAINAEAATAPTESLADAAPLSDFAIRPIETNGFIVRSKNSPRLNTPKQMYNLNTQVPQIEETLSELKTGDFLELSGNLDTFSNDLTVNEIHFVGLKALLGQWLGSDGKVYFFSSFQDMEVSGYDNSKWTYFVLPEEGSSWSLLLVANEQVSAARLSLGYKHLLIEFYDKQDRPPVRLELTRL